MLTRCQTLLKASRVVQVFRLLIPYPWDLGRSTLDRSRRCSSAHLKRAAWSIQARAGGALLARTQRRALERWLQWSARRRAKRAAAAVSRRSALLRCLRCWQACAEATPSDRQLEGDAAALGLGINPPAAAAAEASARVSLGLPPQPRCPLRVRQSPCALPVGAARPSGLRSPLRAKPSPAASPQAAEGPGNPRAQIGWESGRDNSASVVGLCRRRAALAELARKRASCGIRTERFQSQALSCEQELRGGDGGAIEVRSDDGVEKESLPLHGGWHATAWARRHASCGQLGGSTCAARSQSQALSCKRKVRGGGGEASGERSNAENSPPHGAWQTLPPAARLCCSKPAHGLLGRSMDSALLEVMPRSAGASAASAAACTSTAAAARRCPGAGKGIAGLQGSDQLRRLQVVPHTTPRCVALCA